MKSLVFFVLLCGAILGVRAQQNYFVYLQTDNKQPFYVRVTDKLYSSSASGYVVIPKLQAGTHVFSVGFPKNDWPVQVIPVTVTNKDQGYLLKNFDTKGWGLFNMQTLDVVMANAKTTKEAGEPVAANRTDEFSNTLADVVNTPSIKEIEKAPVKEQAVPKPAEPSAPVAAVAQDPPVQSPVSKEIVPVQTAPVPQAVRKMNQSTTAEGMAIIYVVQNETVSDTVSLLIANEEKQMLQEPVALSAPAVQAPTSTASKPGAPSGTAPKFIDIELTNPNDTTAKDTTTAPVNEVVVAKPVEKPDTVAKAAPIVITSVAAATPEAPRILKMINSDCKTTAGEDDFLRIRKKMIAQKTEEMMIEAAQKMFRQKCYSVEQVKNLSVLLLREESKYKLFDTAYPFVHDTDNFKSLEAQLSDPYFISRFKAMIRN